MRLTDLTVAQREAVVTSELLGDCLGRLAVMEVTGIEQVSALLREEFAASIGNAEPREQAAYRYMLAMVEAFRDGDDQRQEQRVRDDVS